VTFTVTLLEDHLGNSRPSVMGHEYCVDAAIIITVYHTADVVTAAQLGLADITAVAITGNSQPALYTADIDCTDTTGAYASTSTVKVSLLSNDDADDAEVPNAEDITDTTIRIRVWGNQ
jgi:hypothetical protein